MDVRALEGREVRGGGHPFRPPRRELPGGGFASACCAARDHRGRFTPHLEEGARGRAGGDDDLVLLARGGREKHDLPFDVALRHHKLDGARNLSVGTKSTA
jgi:hypothetical protein